MFKFASLLSMISFCFLSAAFADVKDDPMKPQWPGSAASSKTTAASTGSRPSIPATRPTPIPAVTFELQSILIINDRKSAVINGKRVQIGQTISGARVVQIDTGKVILSYRGKEKVLMLRSRSAIITPVTANE